MAMTAAVSQSAEGLRIEISGGVAAQMNPSALQAMADWLVGCNRSTRCLENGLNLNAESVHSLAEFVLGSGCLTTGCGMLPGAHGAAAPAGGGSSRCNVSSTSKGLTVLCAEPEARGMDAAAVEKCANAVLACVESHGCVTPNGIVISERAVQSLLQASRETNCLATGLGMRKA